MSIIEASSSSFRLSNYGKKSSSESTASSSEDDENHGPIRHYSYVPTVSLRIKQPPSVSSLINLKQRYYYNHRSSLDKDEPDNEAIIDLEPFSSAEMGSTILQGLILQMKGSHLTKSCAQGDGTNQASPRASGLNGYCEYLRGNEINGNGNKQIKKYIKKVNRH